MVMSGRFDFDLCRTESAIAACAGCQTVETVQHNGKPFALMRRDL